MKRPVREKPLRIMVCFALCLAPSVAAMYGGAVGQLIHKEASLYNSIFVYRNGSIVTLQFGRRPGAPIQSQVDLEQLPRHMLEYTKLMFCGLLYQPEPKRILVLGLGGGVIPREMRRYFPEAEIDVAEIDPAIPPIASRFMGFQADDKLRVHVADGRVFVKRQLRAASVQKYDVVILDAFNSEYIPFHLMTQEFLEEIKGVLASDGVVVANVFYSNRLFDAEFKTFLAVFDHCQVYFGVTCTNAMLVARAQPAPVLTVVQAVIAHSTLDVVHVRGAWALHPFYILACRLASYCGLSIR